MNINDVKEWMMIADDDFDSAKILNEAARKHYVMTSIEKIRNIDALRKIRDEIIKNDNVSKPKCT